MRIVVVGRGPRGRIWERLVARRRDLRLVGTVDPDPGQEATWPTLDSSAMESADAAIIASPPGAHAGQVATCVERGLAVLVEKPLALSTADARAVADSAAAAGRPVLVGQTFAERPLERAVAKALGGFGDLRAGAFISARAHDVTPDHFPDIAHAPLWDFGIHHFDLIRRRAGEAPSWVDAAREGDHYRAAFGWESGLEVTWSHDDGGSLFHRAEWWRGDGGAVSVRDNRAWSSVIGSRPRRLRLPRGSAEGRLLDALARGCSDVAENVRTIEMVVATSEAIETGRRVALDNIRTI